MYCTTSKMISQHYDDTKGTDNYKSLYTDTQQKHS